MIQVVSIGIVGTILVLVLKKEKPELALLLALVVGIIIVFSVMGRLISIMNVIKSIWYRLGMGNSTMGLCFRVVAIEMIGAVGVELLKDAGHGAIAMKVETAKNWIIIVIAIPLFLAVIDVLMGLLKL